MGFNTTNANGSRTTWGECACDELRCKHWNNWDMSDIPRIDITDEMTESERLAFERYNDSCEETELLWIELEIKQLEQQEQKKAQEPRYRDRNNRMGVAGQWAYENRKVREEMLGIDRDSEYAMFDDQGVVGAVRFDDEYDFEESHR